MIVTESSGVSGLKCEFADSWSVSHENVGLPTSRARQEADRYAMKFRFLTGAASLQLIRMSLIDQ